MFNDVLVLYIIVSPSSLLPGTGEENVEQWQGSQRTETRPKKCGVSHYVSLRVPINFFDLSCSACSTPNTIAEPHDKLECLYMMMGVLGIQFLTFGSKFCCSLPGTAGEGPSSALSAARQDPAGAEVSQMDTLPASPTQLGLVSTEAPGKLSTAAQDTAEQATETTVTAETGHTVEDAAMTPPEEAAEPAVVSEALKPLPEAPAPKVREPMATKGDLDHETGQKRPLEFIPGDESDDEFSEQHLFVESVPPEELSTKAIYMRVHRVFKKRKDGTFQLDDRWNKAWADVEGGGRDEVYSIFEKVGYQRDRVV